MRKIIVALVMGLALTFGATACNGDSEDKSTEQVTVTAEAPSTSVPPAPPTTSEAPLPPTTQADPPANDIDAVFLQVLREGTNSWDNLPDADVISLAHSMCGAWDNGSTFEEIAQIFLDSGYNQTDAGYFIGAGTEAYCPEYSKNFQ